MLLGLPVAIGTALFAASPAAAACSLVGTVEICDADDYLGIGYIVPSGDFELLIQSGAVIERWEGGSPDQRDAVHVDGENGGNLKVTLEDGVTISTIAAGGGDGVQVHAMDSGGSVEIISGADITVTTNDPSEFDNAALFGWVNSGSGFIKITQNADSTLDVREVGTGIYGLHEGDGNVTLRSHGDIYGNVGGTGDAWGIYGQSAGGDIYIEQGVSGLIDTDGSGARALTSGAGSATIQTLGQIRTRNDDAHGVFANNKGTGDNSIDHGGSIATSGDNAHGISVTASAGSATIDVFAGSSVTVTGSESIGIAAETKSAGIKIGGAVTSSGAFGVGVSASSSVAAAVDVASGATVTGGWGSDAGGVKYSAGIVMDSVDGKLTNSGSISAGSDRAVFNAGALAATNSGRITGFIGSDTGASIEFTNQAGGFFDVRHFADTDGDGIRDTKGVAVSNLGGGSIDNEDGAIVRLAPVIGEAIVDPADYYIPTTGEPGRTLEAGFYDLTRAGIVQGQFLGTATFTNSGILDLRGSAIGNTLVITGDASASGGPYGGTFISNGGTLLLNTVFNDGIPAGDSTGSYSDVLIVDSTSVGTGATVIRIDRREGPGAETPGNGILLVEVRGSSDADAFSLAGDYADGGVQRVIGGAYAYELEHNGIGGDAGDGNWYLRSAALAPTVPVYEEYPKVLVPLTELPTYRRRVGNRYWANAFGCDDDADLRERHDTSEQLEYCRRDENTRALMDQGGIWGRIEGAHGQYQSVGSTSGARYDSNTLLFQVGVESALTENERGTLFGAITAQYGHVGASVSASGGDGKIRSNGYGLGATMTWLANAGLYVDAQAQVTFLDSDIISTTAGSREILSGHNGVGYALGLEVGHRYAVTPDWTLIPQAQLIYTSISLDDATDVFGATISLLDGDSLRGRIGLAAEQQKSWIASDGTASRLATHGTVNLYNEFLDGARIVVGGLGRASRHDRLWGGVNFGTTYNWKDDRYALYADASAETALRNFGDSYTLSGSVGMKIRW